MMIWSWPWRWRVGGLGCGSGAAEIHAKIAEIAKGWRRLSDGFSESQCIKTG